MEPFASPASLPLAALAAPGLRLLTGPRSLLRAGLAWTAASLPREAPLVVVDGGESFDPFLLAEVASHLGQAPRDLLARVHVAGARTPDRLVSLVEGADTTVRRVGGRHAVVLAPPGLLCRGDLPGLEAARLATRLVLGLEALGRAPRSAVVVVPDPAPAGSGLAPWPAGAGLAGRVAALAAAHYRFGADGPEAAWGPGPWRWLGSARRRSRRR